MDAQVRDALHELIRRYGDSLTEDPARCEALLNGRCAAHKREVNVLIGALRQGVAEDLLSANEVPSPSPIDRLTRRLEDDLGLAPEPARWAVETWALVLGDGLLSATRPGTLATAAKVPDIHGWPADRVQALQRDAARSLGLAVVFRDPLQTPVKLKTGGLSGLLGKGVTISHGPEMVVIPAGSYLMGSPEGEEGRQEREGPQHRVTIARPFALGRHAVTFDDYDAFYLATEREFANDAGWGQGRRGRQPVMGVRWYDAVAYCKWLSRQTGQDYRLPSEAEWEYACRAGTTTPFHFGATISTVQANYDGNYTYGPGTKGQYRQRTVAVGSLPANPWGLYEMHGNVWEWCQDGWKYGLDKSYAGAPTDGSARLRLNADEDWVMRGGCWDNHPKDLRAANREGSGTMRAEIGFPVARTLSP